MYTFMEMEKLLLVITPGKEEGRLLCISKTKLGN
jgi:hypothetical protein